MKNIKTRDEFLNENDFTESNKVEHPVEKQWHYPILIKYGYEPLTKIGIGFVRSYDYQNSDGHIIKCTTGASSDYWRDEENKQGGYHGSLEHYLKSLKSN